MIKVLLLGDYSSLHKYLSDGLKLMDDIQVEFVSNGDGWKKIDTAHRLYPTCHHGIRGLVDRLVIPFFVLKEFKNYDVVQFINPIIYPWIINYFAIKKIVKKNKVISLVAAGDDLAVVNAYRSGKFRFYVYDAAPEILKDYNNSFKSIFVKISNRYLTNIADVIIPSLYEYSIGYNKKKARSIAFPINTDLVYYSENKVGKKIRIFHGINREKAKGTPIIRRAMERIAFEFPNDVEIIYAKHMEKKEYEKLMRTANIVVDQCYGYGYGINACIAMAMGKVVLSSCQDETLNDLGISSSPLIRIGPSEDSIYSALRNVILDKERIPQIGKLSREYVEKYHDYRIVAKEYKKIWEMCLKQHCFFAF